MLTLRREAARLRACRWCECTTAAAVCPRCGKPTRALPPTAADGASPTITLETKES